jgi:hypothetical protein
MIDTSNDSCDILSIALLFRVEIFVFELNVLSYLG